MSIKSKTTLQSDIATLFADNTTREITENDLRTFLTDLLDSLAGVFGSILVTGGAAAQSLTTASAKLTGFTANGNSAGTTPDQSIDQITVGTAGEYEFRIVLNGSGIAATTYTFNLAKGGVVQTAWEVEYLTTGTELFTVVLAGSITLAASDVITVYGKSSAGGGANYTLKNGSLFLKRIA